MSPPCPGLPQDGDEATVTLHEKGDKHRRIGLHFAAAEAISAYTAKAELTRGPLFGARLNSRSRKLGRRPIGAITMYNLVQGYLARLPASLWEEEDTDEDGNVKKVKHCIYTPPSSQGALRMLRNGAGFPIGPTSRESVGSWYIWSASGPRNR